MIKISNIYMPLDMTDELLLKKAAKEIQKKPHEITELRIIKKSIDARKKNDIHFNVSVALKPTEKLRSCADLPPTRSRNIMQRNIRSHPFPPADTDPSS